MEIKIYDNLIDFLVKRMNFDEEHIFVTHFLKEGEFVETHEHPVNEWIICDRGGTFEVQIGEERENIYSLLLKATVIFVPKNTKHSFRALSDIYYFVLRDLESAKS